MLCWNEVQVNMPNEILTKSVLKEITNLYEEFYKITADVNHSGLKGAFRELTDLIVVLLKDLQSLSGLCPISPVS